MLVGAPAIGGQAAGDPVASPEIRKFCTNIAVAAGDARFAWQTSKLNELETRIKARIQDLDSKEAEVRGWIEKREAIEKQAPKSSSASIPR